MEESVFYNLSQDETLGGDSPSIHKIPSQAALKAYIDAKAGSNYFYVEDASGSANTLTIKKSNNALADKVFEWSTDKATWTEITVTDTTGVSIAVPANGRVYLRGNNGALSNNSYSTRINCSAIFNIGGDITCLVAKAGRQATLPAYHYTSLFESSNVKSAENVSIDAVASYGCQNMFKACVSLVAPPKLPIKSLGYNNECYRSMFQGCTSLTTAPDLPATELSQSCYYSMFNGCTALTTAPALPSPTTLNGCYYGMFQNCNHLTRVEVYATAWNTSHATSWLNGVAATGDFYNLGGATIPTGTNGIPSGWTEHTQLP